MTGHMGLQLFLFLSTSISFLVASSDNTTTTEEPVVPEDPINSAQKQEQTSLLPFVNFIFTEITTSSALISWELDAAAVAQNITRLFILVTELDNDMIASVNFSKTDAYRLQITNLDYLTRYKACLTIFAKNDELVFDEPACEKFFTLYEPLNSKAIAAIICIVVLFIMFVVVMALDFALDPSQASSMALKKRMLEVKEKERGIRRALGRSTTGDSLYGK